MKTTQPQLPFSNAPINWLEPLAFKFNQLRDVVAAAERAGFRIFRLKVVAGGYEAQCERKPEAVRGSEKSKDSFLRPIRSRQSCTPDSSYETNYYENTRK